MRAPPSHTSSVFGPFHKKRKSILCGRLWTGWDLLSGSSAMNVGFKAKHRKVDGQAHCIKAAPAREPTCQPHNADQRQAVFEAP